MLSGGTRNNSCFTEHPVEGEKGKRSSRTGYRLAFRKIGLAGVQIAERGGGEVSRSRASNAEKEQHKPGEIVRGVYVGGETLGPTIGPLGESRGGLNYKWTNIKDPKESIVKESQARSSAVKNRRESSYKKWSVALNTWTIEQKSSVKKKRNLREF